MTKKLLRLHRRRSQGRRRLELASGLWLVGCNYCSSGCWWGAVVGSVVVGVTTATLQAALILPHGDAAWDPSLYDDSDNDDSNNNNHKNERDAAQAIATAARQASAWFTSSSATGLDVILIVSPHGVALGNDFGIYLNAEASGSVELGRDRQSSSSYYYTVDLPPVELAADLSQDLVQYLSVQRHQNVTGLQFPENPAMSMLRWAEVIPLLLLERSSSSSQYNPRKEEEVAEQRYIIWTQPLRRLQDPGGRSDGGVGMIPELLSLGALVRERLDAKNISWGVLVSGDLSHRHTADGPYGPADEMASQSLDAAVGRWASSSNVCDTAASALLDTAAKWQERAMSCGFTGFVLLHGILCGSDRHRPFDDPSHTTTRSTAGQQQQQQSTTTTPSWKSQVLVNRNVTYFGMMVATFSPQTTSVPANDEDYHEEEEGDDNRHDSEPMSWWLRRRHDNEI